MWREIPVSAFPALSTHSARPLCGRFDFFGDILGLFRLEIHRNFKAFAFNVNAHHTQICGPNLKIGFDVTFLVDPHDMLPFQADHGLARHANVDKPFDLGRCDAMNDTEIQFRDLAIGDAGWLIQRHGELYAEHEGFDKTFEPLVAEILLAFMRERDPVIDRAWIAFRGAERLGSIFCVASGEPGIAKLRLFLVEPGARGTGLGQRLLDHCMDHARATGHHTLRLWTHESHKAACALYRKNGFQCTGSIPVRSFGVDLVEQTWELPLN